MNKIKIQPPKIPSFLETANFDDMDDRYLSVCTIRDCTIFEEEINRMRFDQVVFKNVTFMDVTFTNIELTDVIFEKCDLSNTDFSGGAIHRVEFIESKLVGLNLTEATFGNVVFDNCYANLSSFGYASLKNVKFERCSLRNGDFFECKFNKIDFTDCDLVEANFTNTSLDGIDLSSCKIDQLSLSPGDLKGCVVSSEQAIAFARLLGIVIKE